MAGSFVSRPRVRALLVAAVVLALVAGGAAWWLTQRTYSTDLSSLGEGRAASGPAPGAASRTLADLAVALRAGDPGAARALAPADDPAARTLLADVARNAAALRVEGLALRYVDELAPGEAGLDAESDAAGREPGAWTAAVELTWRFAGFDRTDLRVEVPVDLLREGDRVAVTGFGGDAGSPAVPLPGQDQQVRGRVRVPVWLTGPVTVRRTEATLVVVAGAGGARYDALARAAVPAVAAELPGWDRRLVVEVPRDVDGLAAVLGAPVADVAGAAALSASPDGTPERRAATHVYVNPEVFGSLGRRGARLVMTHEAAHVATRAPGSPAPVWLVEGFADVVALGALDVPEPVAAAQAAARVRRDGPPTRLPGARDFDTAGTHAGATYEAAWLACLELRDAAGPDGLRRLYERVDAGEDLSSAMRREAGIGLAELTRRWRERLVGLAGAAA